MPVAKDPSLQSSDTATPLMGDSSLRSALTPLVGRTGEIERIGGLLRARSARLLVLTGPGGVGKTRLAMAVARDVASDFPDGVALVGLAALQDPGQVLTTIAAMLGVREPLRDQVAEAIRQAVEEKQMLLVLDNFEQVVDAAPALAEILTQSPRLSILVTSRSVLGVYGEFVFPVPPMTVPSEGDRTIASVRASEAVQLFVNRVCASQPDFRLTSRNARDVASICSRLDGLPLAIELAAARASVFALSTLAQRLETLLPVLEGGPRNVPNRLRTMRNAIAWSYELLSPTEQAVFRRLSIFLNRWSLEAAEAVTLDPKADLGLDEMQLVSTVASLVDKSLIQRLGSDEGDRHFAILQTLREFGLNELGASGERDTVEQRHATYMLRLAKRAQPHMTGPNQVSWLNQIEVVRADLRSAFQWFMANARPEQALELSEAVWRFGYTRGHILETRDQLEAALRQVSARTSLRAGALNAAGVLSNVAGDPELTRAYHQEALDIAREIDDPTMMAIAHVGLGDITSISGEPADAQRHYEEADQIYTALDDQRGMATAQTNLANLFWSLGNLDAAVQSNEAAKGLYAAAGDQRGMAWSVTNIGRIAAEKGDYDRAHSNLTQAMELYELLGDRSGIAETLEAFALVAARIEDSQRAAILLGAADALRLEISHPVPATDRAAFDDLITLLRGALGDELETAWQRGGHVPLDEAIALARAIEVQQMAPPPIAVVDASEAAHTRFGITERELEVLKRLGAGESDKQIAEVMFISPRTVQTHVQNLLNKLDVNSRSAAVARAFREDILR